MLSHPHLQRNRLWGPLYVHLSILPYIPLFMSNQQLDKLKPVAAAAYDCGRRNSCFGVTRALLLSNIQEWVNNGCGQPIYVLYGVAGIGKSTVAKTVAERARETLGATFFFSRDEDNRKTLKSFFTTLAYQLSCHYPEIAKQINIALEEAPEVADRDPVYQFDRLIASRCERQSGKRRSLWLSTR
jgi:hypothetical protein